MDYLINYLIYYIIIILFIIILFFVIKKILKNIISNNKHFNHLIFLVRLPKDRPGDQEKEFNVQSLREEIAKGETLFSSIGGLRAQKKFKSFILGRDDHFSFEIVAHKKKIAFYIVVPSGMERYVEQQVHAHYSDASIEQVDDYNIFHDRDKWDPEGYAITYNKDIDFMKQFKKLQLNVPRPSRNLFFINLIIYEDNCNKNSLKST